MAVSEVVTCIMLSGVQKKACRKACKNGDEICQTLIIQALS